MSGDHHLHGLFNQATSTKSCAPAAACVNSCMETLEYTPLEPGIVETKYYAPNIGFILEIDPEGEWLELVEFANP